MGRGSDMVPAPSVMILSNKRITLKMIAPTTVKMLRQRSRKAFIYECGKMISSDFADLFIKTRF